MFPIKSKFIVAFLVFISLFAVYHSNVSAQVCSGKDDCQNKIKEYEEKLSATRAQKTSLSSQIDLMETKIELTRARIQNTQHIIEETQIEIEELGGKIDRLNSSLDHLSQILLQKIVEGYKHKEVGIMEIFFAPDANTLANQFKYLQLAQENDRRLAVQTQQIKVNYSEQKDLRETKITELETLKKTLDAQTAELGYQRQSKERLLIDTKNDEATYQTLLARARAEFAAIQGIVSGAGTETKLRDVSKGEAIATIISGSSCNSSGSHLHFIVQEGGTVINPFNKLKPVDSVNKSGGDPFNPSGSWDWPVPPTINLHQGYGVTSYVQSGGLYDFHNGIDITGSSYDVVAVEAGALYRGSYSGNGGCTLPYVRVNHTDSNISTLYLHVYAK